MRTIWILSAGRILFKMLVGFECFSHNANIKKSPKNETQKNAHYFAGGWGSPAPLKVFPPSVKTSLHVFFCCVKMNEHFLVVRCSKAFILTPCRYLSFLLHIQQRAKSTRWAAANQPLICSLPAGAFISWYLPLPGLYLHPVQTSPVAHPQPLPFKPPASSHLFHLVSPCQAGPANPCGAPACSACWASDLLRCDYHSSQLHL